jgi:2-isopropylmalate synthase
MAAHIAIFDTTLRDGEQAPGYSMNLEEKLRFARQLEALGVDVIEAGFAIASPGDFTSVKEIATAISGCTIASLARALEKDIDTAWEAVKHAARPRIHTFIATSDLHLQYKLKMSREKAHDKLSPWLPMRETSVQRWNFLPRMPRDRTAIICVGWWSQSLMPEPPS